MDGQVGVDVGLNLCKGLQQGLQLEKWDVVFFREVVADLVHIVLNVEAGAEAPLQEEDAFGFRADAG